MNEDEKVFTFVSVVPRGCQRNAMLGRFIEPKRRHGHTRRDNQSELLLIPTRFACTAVARPVNLHKATSINFTRAVTVVTSTAALLFCFSRFSSDVTRTSAIERPTPINFYSDINPSPRSFTVSFAAVSAGTALAWTSPVDQQLNATTVPLAVEDDQSKFS